MHLADYTNIVSAISAGAAAILWWLSARVKLPMSFNVHVVKPHGGVLGGNPLEGTYMGHAHSDDFEFLAKGLAKQSRLSSRAAIAAATAAASQSIALLAGSF